MRSFRRIATGASLALALAASAGARAETLVYVGPGLIGTVDSSNPAVDNTPGNNGPLGYTLPGGYQAQGAKVSDDGRTLYILGFVPAIGANPSPACQLFSANTQGVNGEAVISPAGQAYPCNVGPSNGDLDLVSGSGSSSVIDAYIVANGNSGAFEIQPGGAGAVATSAPVVISWTSGTPNLIGVAGLSNVSATQQAGYAIDAQAGGAVQLSLTVTPDNPGAGTAESISGSETPISAPSSAVTATMLQTAASAGNTSFDYSAGTGTYYLYLSNSVSIPNPYQPGQTVPTGGIYSASSLSAGFTAIGSPPGATYVPPGGGNPSLPLAVVAAKGLDINNNGNGGGGAFGPGNLILLIALAVLRLRASRKPGASRRP